MLGCWFWALRYPVLKQWFVEISRNTYFKNYYYLEFIMKVSKSRHFTLKRKYESRNNIDAYFKAHFLGIYVVPSYYYFYYLEKFYLIQYNTWGLYI